MWTFHELIHAAPRSKQADDLLAARALHEAAILVGIPSEPIGPGTNLFDKFNDRRKCVRECVQPRFQQRLFRVSF